MGPDGQVLRVASTTGHVPDPNVPDAFAVLAAALPLGTILVARVAALLRDRSPTLVDMAEALLERRLDVRRLVPHHRHHRARPRRPRRGP